MLASDKAWERFQLRFQYFYIENYKNTIVLVSYVSHNKLPKISYAS